MHKRGNTNKVKHLHIISFSLHGTLAILTRKCQCTQKYKCVCSETFLVLSKVLMEQMGFKMVSKNKQQTKKYSTVFGSSPGQVHNSSVLFSLLDLQNRTSICTPPLLPPPCSPDVSECESLVENVLEFIWVRQHTLWH